MEATGWCTTASPFNIYAVDAAARQLLEAGGPEENEELSEAALYTGFQKMGLGLEDLKAVYIRIQLNREPVKREPETMFSGSRLWYNKTISVQRSITNGILAASEHQSHP